MTTLPPITPPPHLHTRAHLDQLVDRLLVRQGLEGLGAVLQQQQQQQSSLGNITVYQGKRLAVKVLGGPLSDSKTWATVKSRSSPIALTFCMLRLRLQKTRRRMSSGLAQT